MTTFKQTWWDDNLPDKFSTFETWIGDKNAESKKYFREYVKNGEYKSLIDLGCGTATEFFAYKEEFPELEYLGVDSSKILYDKNVKLGVPMLHSPAEKTGLEDNHSEVVFARHVLEHQPLFKPVLSEMIRLASKVAIHVFFKVPTDDSHTDSDRIKNPNLGYSKDKNLYHNRFNKIEIENYLSSHDKVNSFEWIKITKKDSGLIIKMNV
jgi:ubiquinone/menaquinone biosynthesis C-methylase UbiE